MTTVADVMTRGVKTLSPSDTVAQAAQAMAELNVGSIPVCDGRKLQGIVTDRDITVRLVAKGLVDRTADPSSRRQVSLRLRPAGRALIAESTRRRTDRIGRLLASIPEADQERLAEALNQLVAAAGR